MLTDDQKIELVLKMDEGKILDAKTMLQEYLDEHLNIRAATCILMQTYKEVTGNNHHLAKQFNMEF